MRGGNYKYRALRLNTGNYNWCSEGAALKTKILNVVYNASNNELVRTNTLVKNTIVMVDATTFRNYIIKHYYGMDDEKFEFDFHNWGKDENLGNQHSKSKYLKRRKDTKIDHKI